MVEKRGGMCYDNGNPVKKNETKENNHMFENGTFAIAGEDGKPVRCEVLFTYDCEANGRSYVVFTVGEGDAQQLFANRYTANDAGEPQLWPLEDEAEYQIVRGCFEELKAKLMEQANEQAAEPQAEA